MTLDEIIYNELYFIIFAYQFVLFCTFWSIHPKLFREKLSVQTCDSFGI